MKVNLKEYGHGNFIKIIREWSGLTQKEFGKLINKSERTIQAYESGNINYKIYILEELSRRLNISITAEKNNLK